MVVGRSVGLDFLEIIEREGKLYILSASARLEFARGF